MSTVEVEVLSPESVVSELNTALVPQDKVREMLAILAPLVPSVEASESWSRSLVVKTATQAKEANDKMKAIALDVATAVEAIAGIKGEAKRRHKMVCDLENQFLRMDNARKAAKIKVLEYDARVKAEAEAEQRRLQAIADEKARKERERQEELARIQREKEEAARIAEQEARQRAANAKNEEDRIKANAEAEKARRLADAAAAKASERQENAAAVVAPTITMQANTSGAKARKEVVVTIIDTMAFIRAVAERPDLLGFVDIDAFKLKRAKQANAMFTAPGVTFSEKNV